MYAYQQLELGIVKIIINAVKGELKQRIEKYPRLKMTLQLEM